MIENINIEFKVQLQSIFFQVKQIIGANERFLNVATLKNAVRKGKKTFTKKYFDPNSQVWGIYGGICTSVKNVLQDIFEVLYHSKDLLF